MRFDLIRRSALSVVLLLTLTVSALAQGQPNATPESIGMSGERLQRLSTAMKQAVDEGQVAGLVTLKDEEALDWLNRNGYSDRLWRFAPPA